ncbi:MAG: N-acetyltransferase [Candidatus Lokiarchaeota archaeon]|nr:N-acetyltransferase [Candidatus Lokiarchaeota archaeon]
MKKKYLVKLPINNCKIGENVKIIEPVNLYGCVIGKDCFVGPFVEIQKNVTIGYGTRIQSHCFICDGVSIGKHCFIGHGTMFTNDLFVDSPNFESWIKKETKIGDNVRIGSNVTLLPINVGDNAIIGAGAVVTKNVPANCVVAGNPAKIIKNLKD